MKKKTKKSLRDKKKGRDHARRDGERNMRKR